MAAEPAALNNFSDFCAILRTSGFSMGGGNAKGIYAVVPFGWEEQELLDLPVRWHTGDPDTDPWEWRMRVLEEESDIAYAKLFFKTSGYITAEWYPEFLAVRRNGERFRDAYLRGTVSHAAKRIYEAVAGNGATPLHAIKALGGFSREEHGEFDRALIELQTRMFLTMSGRAQKQNRNGESYGWNSTVLTTVEDFWESRSVALPARDKAAAYERIRRQILSLNPAAKDRNIDRFIRG